MMWVTSTIRVTPLTRARTRSPTLTEVAGLAGLSLTRTCPARHAWAASERVLVRRTAHSHRSTRVAGGPGGSGGAVFCGSSERAGSCLGSWSCTVPRVASAPWVSKGPGRPRYGTAPPRVRHRSADVVAAVDPGDVAEGDVDTAGVLPDTGVGHREVLDGDVGGVGELRPRSDTDLPGVAHRSGLSGHGAVVAVLDEDGVVSGVGQVDPVDDRTAAFGDAEDAASAAAGPHFTHADVDGVAVADPSVAVGHAERRVPGAGSRVLRVHQAHVRVDGVVEQQSGVGDVACHDSADRDAVHAVGFHAVIPRARHVDVVDADVAGADTPVVMVVDAHAQAAGEPQVHLAEVDVGRVAHKDAEVGVAGDADVG